MFIVYKHTNKINGKAYIGYTSKTLEQRWDEHVSNAKNNSKCVFHKAIMKYGVEEWDHEILETHITLEDANNAEIRLIDEHWTFIEHKFAYGYNMTPGGDGRRFGTKSSQETCEKIRNAHKGKKQTQEHSQKISKALSGRQFTELHKKHQSQCRIGHKNPFFGKQHSEKFKKHISNLKSKNVLQFDLNDQFITEYSSITIATNITGAKHIGECCNGVRKSSGRFKWKWS